MAGGWGWCLLILGFAGLALGQSPEKRRTGNVCDVDMDCPDNAFCKGGSYCVCKDGFVYASINSTSKGCLKEATVGEECTQHIQCHSKLGVHAECVDDLCACKPGSHLEGDRCYETAVVGNRCLVNENCYIGDRSNPETAAFCVRGFCACELHYSPRDGGTRCVRDAKIGEKCEDQLQCAGIGLMCQGTCQCRDGMVANNYTQSCLQVVKELGMRCDYDVQCSELAGARDAPAPGAALCLGGACTCAYNARAAGSPARCWHRHLPGQDCHRDEECVSEEDEQGYCLNSHCTCDTCTPSPADFAAASALASPLALVASAAILVAAMLRQ